MQFISSPNVPPPAGHYSQAVRSGDFLFISGMLPGPAAKGETDDFERQARAALAHCRNALAAADGTLKNVAQCTAYIVGIENWPHFNKIYADIFGYHRPARAVVPVPELHHGYMVEIQMTAHFE